MTVDDIALTLHRRLGAKGIVHLLAVMGSAEAIYSVPKGVLTDVAGLKEDIAEDIVCKSSHRAAEAELKFLRQTNLSGVASTDAEYPPMLLECNDYPHVLYVRGNVGALSGKTVSVVGTRESTPYGNRMCDVLIGRLAEIEPEAVIVSGLAFGIDGAAHRAALRYGLKTVAVIANTLPDVSPAQHRSLAEEIFASGGAVITELHSQTKQNGNLYIPRNRIIAGMSRGTLIVESKFKGGSLDTADLADGYERTVMAVPGRVGDRCSYGTNNLIVKRKAAMVCSGDDIVRELGWDITLPGIIPQCKRDKPLLNADERRIMECFGEGEELDMDTLTSRSGVPAGQLAALLFNLELNDVIRPLPGRKFESTGLWTK